MGKTFEIRTDSVPRVVSAIAQRSDPELCGVVFVSGRLGDSLDRIARELADESGGRWLLARVPGGLTERGEIEQESAAVGMIIPTKQAEVLVSAKADTHFGLELGRILKASPGASALTLLRGDETDDSWLVRLDEALGSNESRIFGGGVLPHGDLYVAGAGELSHGRAAAFVVKRPWLGRVTASSACRLLSPLVEVTKTRGPMLLELDGAPALAMLGQAAQDQDEQPLILLAIATGDRPLAPEGRQLALRAIHGVDPMQGGLMVGEELPLGTKLAFAVRDAHGAREDLQAHLRTLRRNCAGTAPAFGIYVSCAGRGTSLYETPNVDTRLIAEHFPSMPLLGLHSTFELAPLGGRLTPQIYTGVLAVFCAPS